MIWFPRIKGNNRPFAASHSRGTKPPCWRAKVALGQDKQRQLPFQIIYVFCLSCPSANLTLQRGGFVMYHANGLLQRAYYFSSNDIQRSLLRTVLVKTSLSHKQVNKGRWWASRTRSQALTELSLTCTMKTSTLLLFTAFLVFCTGPNSTQGRTEGKLI